MTIRIARNTNLLAYKSSWSLNRNWYNKSYCNVGISSSGRSVILLSNHFKSTSTAPSPTVKTTQTHAIAATTLKEVPSLPYIGSLLPQYSKIPPFDPNEIYKFWSGMRTRFGNFYKLDFPGFGKGRDGTLYILNDPKEMMKVLRQEKTSVLPYPRGIVQMHWPLIKYLKETNDLMITPITKIDTNDNEDNASLSNNYDQDGFYGRGATWKKYRTFLQTDLLSPQSSKQYILGMVQSAEIASQAISNFSSDENCHILQDINEYFNRCAFDMFHSLMFGELSKTADLSSSATEENKEFCLNAVNSLNLMIYQMMTPHENVLGNMLGIQTKTYKEMGRTFEKLFATAERKYRLFRHKFDTDYDSMTALEKNSYLAQAIQRQKEDPSVTEDQLMEIIKLMLSAAVDTTASPMAWNLCHLAANQDVQSRLYNELSAAIEKTGSINEEFLKQSTCPYLHAVIRESHRLTPATPIALNKENALSDLEIHGSIIPKDSMITFDNYSLGVDPEYMEDPTVFRPERWLKDAVDARKGTKAEALDHPFYKAPFSQGSRQCPASRVATNEIFILISQLVLDWKITAPSNIKCFEDMEYTVGLMIIPNLPKLEFERRT